MQFRTVISASLIILNIRIPILNGEFYVFIHHLINRIMRILLFIFGLVLVAGINTSCDVDNTTSLENTPESVAEIAKQDPIALRVRGLSADIIKMRSEALLQGGSLVTNEVAEAIYNSKDVEMITAKFALLDFPNPEKIAQLYAERTSLVEITRPRYEELTENFTAEELTLFESLLPQFDSSMSAEQAIKLLTL
jgi:hypothetical protein